MPTAVAQFQDDRSRAGPIEIDVVIPLYNKADCVRAAIESVLEQSCQPARIIVVDDGSTDGGAEIVGEMSDPRIQLIRQENAGVSAARNRGIAEATSELIAFLDADDVWMPGHLEAVRRLRITFPQCDVFATSYVFRVASGVSDRRPIFRGLLPEPWEGVLDDYFGIAANSDPPLWTSAVAATRASLQSIGGFPVGIPHGEDLLTWARLAMRYELAFCTKCSAVFNQPAFDGGVPTRRPPQNDRVARELADLLAGADDRRRESLRRYLGLWHKMQGTMYLRLKDRQAASRELKQAWLHGGFGWRLLAYRAVAASPVGLTGVSDGAIRRARQIYRAVGSRQPGTAARKRLAIYRPLPRSNRPKIIVISGNNGGGNCGDELMCEAACSYFLQNLPDADVVTDSFVPTWQPNLTGLRVIPQVAYDPSSTSMQRMVKPFAKGLRLLLLPSLQRHRSTWPLLRHGAEFLSELSNASALFFSGCGVLTDRYAGMLLAWRAMMLAAAARDVPIYISGIGGGPLSSQWLRKLLRRPLAQAEVITCRDSHHTRKILVDLDVPQDRLTIVPDDAVFYSSVSVDDALGWIARNTSIDVAKPYVVLSLMQGGGIGEKDLRLIGKAARMALPGVPKLLVSLAHHDIAAMRITAQEDPDARVAPVASAGMTKSILGGASMVLSTRYHGCVFAFSQGVPAIGIVADDYWQMKIDGVCRMFAADGNLVDLRTASAEKLQSMIASVAQDRQEQARQIGIAGEELRPLAYYAHRQLVERISRSGVGNQWRLAGV
jgi:glycosyltransferase involved in cell wall biosynthesis/polysaccharide pyruvyl transferase WcaK-like protein